MAYALSSVEESIRDYLDEQEDVGGFNWSASAFRRMHGRHPKRVGGLAQRIARDWASDKWRVEDASDGGYHFCINGHRIVVVSSMIHGQGRFSLSAVKPADDSFDSYLVLLMWPDRIRFYFLDPATVDEMGGTRHAIYTEDGIKRIQFDEDSIPPQLLLIQEVSE